MEPTLDTTTAQTTPQVGDISEPTGVQAPNALFASMHEGDTTEQQFSLTGTPEAGLMTTPDYTLTAAPEDGLSTPLEGAVVSSEPAANISEQNQTFVAQSEPGEVADAGEPLYTEEPEPPEGYEFEEPDFTEEEEEIAGIQKDLEANEEQIYRDLENLQIKSDRITQEQISAIKGQFKQLANESREISKRRQAGLRVMGFRQGRAQFAPEIQSGIIAGEKRALVTQLGKLAALEATAISEAKQLQLDREFSLANSKIAFARDIRQEKRETLKDLQLKLDEERELWNTIENQNKIIDKIQGGERDPMAIYNQLGGKVTFDEVTAITDTYKDEENRVEEAIGFALQTGEATQDEVAFMNDTARSFAERKTAAYRIIGRVAQADRALDRSYKSAQIANITDQIKARKDKIKADASGKLEDVKNDAQKAVSLLSLISDLEQHRDLEAATGLSSYLYYEPGGGVEEFSRTHGQLKDTMTLDNLGLMKGVLSETDIQILASAATKLNRGLPTESYVAELSAMKSNILASEEFNTAIDLGYINPTDLAIAMNFSNEDIADMKELGVISTEIEIQDYSSTDPQSYYGIR